MVHSAEKRSTQAPAAKGKAQRARPRPRPPSSPWKTPAATMSSATSSLLTMFSSNRAPQRDGKAPASPVSPSPLAPPLRQSTFSADYWDGFYMGWKMTLQKASRLYGDKGLNNIITDIGPRVEHIPSSPSSPNRSASSPSSHPSPYRSASSPPPSSSDWSSYQE
ncbi:hypothetical protein Taro_012559 [Colocasia esculenta]|uniref:Uncharacterized protein n=1 Tax=Colocasia esculenta TaxID=4460 RepID=A0A843UJH0_COLES|nr:hypothetical protein [Colocasia esculenta]